MPREKQTAGYAERLAIALQRGPRPMSVRRLQRKLAGEYPGLRGTTYGGVRQYAEGKVLNPRMELLRAIAEVLEVRGDWLAFGTGEMTRDQQEAREAADAAGPGLDAFNQQLDRALREGLRAGLPGLEDVGLAYGRLSRAVAILTLWRDDTTAEHPLPHGFGELARRVARAVAGPAEALDVDFVEMARRSPRAAEAYISAIDLALQALAMHAGPFGWVGLDEEGHHAEA